MSCNLLANPSFEAGALSPWHASAAGVTQIVKSSDAYSGSYYLNLETAIDNGGNFIAQFLKELDTSTNYTVGVHAQFPKESAASECNIVVYMGSNFTSTVGSTYLSTGGEWVFVGGSYQPKFSRETLHIFARCDLEDPSYTSNIYLDAAVFEASSPCPSRSKSKTGDRKRRGVRRG